MSMPIDAEKFSFSYTINDDTWQSKCVTFEFDGGINIHDMMLEIRQFLLAVGYAESSIDEYLGDL